MAYTGPDPRRPRRPDFSGYWVLIIVFCIILALAGCSRNVVQKLPEATPKVVFQLGNAYGILQAGAISYAKLEVCPPGESFSIALPCRTVEATAQIAAADAAFVASYAPLSTWLRDPETLDGLTLAETLAGAKAALDHMRLVMDIHNVGALQ